MNSKIYEVSYERNGIYHSNLATAENQEAIFNWYKENRPRNNIIAVKIATQDSFRPGKPNIVIK